MYFVTRGWLNVPGHVLYAVCSLLIRGIIHFFAAVETDCQNKLITQTCRVMIDCLSLIEEDLKRLVLTNKMPLRYFKYTFVLRGKYASSGLLVLNNILYLNF